MFCTDTFHPIEKSKINKSLYHILLLRNWITYVECIWKTKEHIKKIWGKKLNNEIGIFILLLFVFETLHFNVLTDHFVFESGQIRSL